MAMKHFGANTYGYVFNTIQKWDSILTGSCAFFEVYQAIKNHDRKYGDITIRYSIQLHGKKGTSKGHAQYMHGCFIYYSRFEGKLTITHATRKVRIFLLMLRSAHQYGAEIVAPQQEKEERKENARKLQLQKKVLKNWYI